MPCRAMSCLPACILLGYSASEPQGHSGAYRLSRTLRPQRPPPASASGSARCLCPPAHTPASCPCQTPSAPGTRGAAVCACRGTQGHGGQGVAQPGMTHQRAASTAARRRPQQLAGPTANRPAPRPAPALRAPGLALPAAHHGRLGAGGQEPGLGGVADELGLGLPRVVSQHQLRWRSIKRGRRGGVEAMPRAMILNPNCTRPQAAPTSAAKQAPAHLARVAGQRGPARLGRGGRRHVGPPVKPADVDPRRAVLAIDLRPGRQGRGVRYPRCTQPARGTCYAARHHTPAPAASACAAHPRPAPPCPPAPPR